jgi:hypothetical protein
LAIRPDLRTILWNVRFEEALNFVVLRNQQKVTVIFECHYCLIDIQAWTFIQEIVRRHLLGFQMIIQREETFFGTGM